jgi:preprotein translocase subunit SecD
MLHKGRKVLQPFPEGRDHDLQGSKAEIQVLAELSFLDQRAEILAAIVLDDEILEIATIRSQITGMGVLSGNFTKEEVRQLVSLLRSGPLPAQLSLLWKRVYDSDGESAEE